ncbi:MAG: putative TonB family protein [Verrucomicrobiales bacterium]|nr:putative TonB family protein [Verrucomicrobiales bacterium]
MEKMEKKCLLASVTLHAFLVIVVLVGSAFIIPKTTPPFNDPVRMIPSKLIDEALSGGGGNPNAPRTDDVKKGNTTVPQPPVAEIPAPVKHEIKSTPPPPAPAAKPEPVKPKPDKAKPEKVEKLASKEKPPKEPTPTKPSKTESKIPVKDAKNAPLELKPVVRENDSKRKAEERKRTAEEKSRADAEAREARESAKRWAETNAKLAKALGKAADHLEEGFANGTKVDVDRGPGGEAYANYGAFVQAIYDDAWEIFRDLASNDFATTVKVTIARDGTVTGARIIQKSGNPAMDKSVQKALDKVKFVHPFPEGSTDRERSFTIEFNLKAKRLYG